MALKPTRVVLPNGITVIAKANHTSPTVSLLVGVRTGAYADPPEKDGTAALCARVLDRGTAKRTADVIADDLDGRGASLSVVAGRHQMALAATCLADDFEPVLTLVADVARHPGFPDKEIATRREQLITSIRQEEDNPATMAADAFAKALYGDHPYARKVRGTIAGLEAIRRQDLVRFHQKGFDPPSMTVVVVGDFVEELALGAIAKLFGDWSPLAKATGDKTSVIKVPDPAIPGERRLVPVPMMNKAQADVVYGFLGVRRSDPEFPAISVMNNALGQYAIGGRLGDSIRERQGMAYYVFSALDASFGPGPFTIRAGVAGANVEKTIASIDQELDLVLSKGFTPQEIDESKSYMIGSLPRQLETNAAIASFLLNVETFGLGLDYDERLPGLIGAVTKEAADAAARRLLNPVTATIGVAGPWTPPPPSLAESATSSGETAPEARAASLTPARSGDTRPPVTAAGAPSPVGPPPVEVPPIPIAPPPPSLAESSPSSGETAPEARAASLTPASSGDTRPPVTVAGSLSADGPPPVEVPAITSPPPVETPAIAGPPPPAETPSSPDPLLDLDALFAPPSPPSLAESSTSSGETAPEARATSQTPTGSGETRPQGPEAAPLTPDKPKPDDSAL
jgi:zinc protease